MFEHIFLPHVSWDEDITEVRSFADLPVAARDYVQAIETWTGLSVTYIGVGPRRDQVIVRWLGSLCSVGYSFARTRGILMQRGPPRPLPSSPPGISKTVIPCSRSV